MIKVSVMLPSGPAPETDHAVIFEFKVPSTTTVKGFVAEMRSNGGLFMNDEKTDWVPVHRIVRVWDGKA